MITAIKIIFLLGFLIFIHEMGHYIVAKICKIKVNEFAIGFGPKILSKKTKNTNYELRLIPLGGFVNLEGEAEKSKKDGSFSEASIGKRIAIVAAGAIVNIIFGLLVFMVLIFIRYLMLKDSNIIEAIKYVITSTGTLIKTMFESIFNLFIGKLELNDMSGPVGISKMVSETSDIAEFIYLLSIISISLGVTNLLPIIPLDGGKILLLIIEKIRKKPIKEQTELKIQSLGFILLIIFSIVITFNDIIKII